MGFERVKIEDLYPHPKNPRRGNIEAIKNSLAANGQYKPIVVNVQTKHILAGNHTYKAAKELGWQEIEVVWVDVPEQEELRILLADNKTSDMAIYDSHELTMVIQEIANTEMGIFGTGFEDEELNEILNSIDDSGMNGDMGGEQSHQARIMLFVDKDEEGLLRDRLLSLAFEIPSLKIR